MKILDGSAIKNVTDKIFVTTQPAAKRLVSTDNVCTLQASKTLGTSTDLFKPSRIEKADSALRLLAAAALALCIACLQKYSSCLASLAPGLVLVLLARPVWSKFLGRLLAVNVFIAFIWLIVPLTAGGEAVAQFGFLKVSREGLRLAILATLKANAIFCVFMGLLGPMSPAKLGCALKKLHCPDKLTLLFMFMGRAFYILRSEWRELTLASRLRGFIPACNRHTYHTLGSLLGVLLVKSHDRSERMREAMLLRGFDGKLKLCCAWQSGRENHVFCLAVLVCLCALCFLEWG